MVRALYFSKQSGVLLYCNKHKITLITTKLRYKSLNSVTCKMFSFLLL